MFLGYTRVIYIESKVQKQFILDRFNKMFLFIKRVSVNLIAHPVVKIYIRSNVKLFAQSIFAYLDSPHRYKGILSNAFGRKIQKGHSTEFQFAAADFWIYCF